MEIKLVTVNWEQLSSIIKEVQQAKKGGGDKQLEAVVGNLMSDSYILPTLEWWDKQPFKCNFSVLQTSLYYFYTLWMTVDVTRPQVAALKTYMKARSI